MILLMPAVADASVQVSVNTTRPVFHISLAQDDGTDQLAADTNYYFQCFLGGYGYEGMSVSPASEEFNITTNSTHRWINISNIQNMCDSYNISTNDKGVHCRWSINRSFKDWGGEGYLPASFSDNESTRYQYWLERLGRPGYYSADFTFGNSPRCNSNKASFIVKGSDLIVSNSYSGYYIFHPEISTALSTRERLEKTFDITAGVADIYVTDTNTWDDFIDGIASSDASDRLCTIGENSAMCMGHIYGSGTLSIETKSLTLLGGDSDCDHLQLTKGSQMFFETFSWKWTHLKANLTDSSATLVGNMAGVFLDPAVSDNAFITAENRYTNYNPWDGWNFNLKSAGYHESRYFGQDDYGYNGNYYGVYEYVSPSGSTGHSTAYFENLTFYNNGKTTFDIKGYVAYISGCYNVTRDYDCKNVVSDRADKRAIVAYSNYEPDNEWCGNSFNFSFHGDVSFKIVDNDGNEISGANVTLSNAYNTYSDTTDADGKLTHDAMFYRVYYNNSQNKWPWLYASILEMGTYNLTITKDGYKDYSTTVTINAPQDWTIALEEKPAWNSTKPVSLKIWNSTGYVIMKLTDDGDMAIAGTLHENTDDAPADYVWGIPGLLWLDSQGNLYLLGVRVWD